MDLFEHAHRNDPSAQPFAEAVRPDDFEGFFGQDEVVGVGRMLRDAVERDRVPSLILWGPPGTGKTTLARIMAGRCGHVFEAMRLKKHDDPSVFGALHVLALAARSTLCIEPTSDTLVRSHLYASVLAGCVPVILDTELPFELTRRAQAGASSHAPSAPTPHLTEWAWRVPEARPSLALNYSRFAVIDEAMPLVRGERPGLLPSLVRLATDPAERPRLKPGQRCHDS